MKDEKIRQLISRYVDGLLNEAEQKDVERLIAESKEYAAFYSQLQALAGQADRFEIGGDEEYWQARKDAVLERISRIEPEKVVDITERRPFNTVYKLLAVAASVVLVALISIHESENIPWIKGLFEGDRETPRAVSKSESPLVDSSEYRPPVERSKAGTERGDITGQETAAEWPVPTGDETADAFSSQDEYIAEADRSDFAKKARSEAESFAKLDGYGEKAAVRQLSPAEPEVAEEKGGVTEEEDVPIA
ncbi:MAG: hypothetical protein JSV44_07980, partial [Candidatus Zixiibacteriota bacterium]